MRALKRSLVVLPVAAVLALTASTGAQAFDWGSIGWDAGAQGNGARSYLQRDGEHLYILDSLADGHSAVSEVEYGSRHLTYWNPNGADTTVDKNLSITDGTYVRYNACWGEYSNLKVGGCSYWVGVTV